MDSTESASSSQNVVYPARTPTLSSGGQFSTPALKRCAETSEAAEPRALFKRRQLTLASAKLQQKEQLLQTLRLVSHYQQNHSLPELASLTNCWRSAAQQALTDLRDRLEERGRPTDVAELITHLGIDPGLVRYDAEEEAFREPDGT